MKRILVTRRNNFKNYEANLLLKDHLAVKIKIKPILQPVDGEIEW